MNKVTVVSPANIAFVKYWGKADSTLRLPANSSLSLNLSAAFSTCTMEYDPQLTQHDITFSAHNVKAEEVARIVETIDRVRTALNIPHFARVVTKNSFPRGAGIASSASGLSAVTCAAAWAWTADITEKTLTTLARQASGSAARSIPDAWVVWEKGHDDESSYAHSVFPVEHWDIVDLIAVDAATQEGQKQKAIGSTEGQALALQSQYYQSFVKEKDHTISAILAAITDKDFATFAKLLQVDAMAMHGVMLTSWPTALYWEPMTVAVMQAVLTWQQAGEAVAFTIDAGPTVHVICQAADAERFRSRLQALPGVGEVITAAPSIGTHQVETHLF